MTKSLETIYDEFVEMYLQGNFTEGHCSWNGDDALMSPFTFGNRFAEHCSKLGYDAYDYQGHMKELIDFGVPFLHYYSMGKSDNIHSIAKEVF